MPMPVSDTSKDTTEPAVLKTGWLTLQPSVALAMVMRISPCR